MKLILAAIISVSGFLASAQTRPAVEPGPVMKLENSAIEAVDALLLAKAEDLEAFIKSGNVTIEVSRRNWQPGLTSYDFTRQYCSHGGFSGGMCLGGSKLHIVIKETQYGSLTKIEATSSIQLIR